MQCHLTAQCLQVGQGATVLTGHDLVAGTVVTDAFAEGYVQVKPDRAAWTRTLGTMIECQLVIHRTHLGGEAVGRGVGRVAWARLVDQPQHIIGQSRGYGGHCRGRLDRHGLPEEIGGVPHCAPGLRFRL